MKREKFLQDAKLSPSRYYRNPTDVIRDRRLTNADRLDILEAWERETRSTGADTENDERIQELRRIRSQLEQEDDAQSGQDAGA
jgi:hypothetical protein